jgi:hypothetical protein
MQYRFPPKIRNSLVAGLCGSVAHWVLMATRDFVDFIPEFQPYYDVQRVLHSVIGSTSMSSVTWVIPLVTGALFVGFVFGKIYFYLPSSNFIYKGIAFGIFAWLTMGLMFFPFVGHGVFAIELGLGIKPAVLMLGMLLTYSLTMSVVYDRLNTLK